MGDRALVIFTDGKEVSPVMYLHWHGSRVPELLAQHKIVMASRGADVSYAAARFTGIVHAIMPESNLSLGMWNADRATTKAAKIPNSAALEALSHGTRASWLWMSTATLGKPTAVISRTPNL